MRAESAMTPQWLLKGFVLWSSFLDSPLCSFEFVQKSQMVSSSAIANEGYACVASFSVLLLSGFCTFFLKKKSHKNNFVWPVQEKLIPNVNRSPVDFASFQPVLWFFYRFCARPVTGFIRTERGSSSRSDRLVRFDFHYTVIYIYIYVRNFACWCWLCKGETGWSD